MDENRTKQFLENERVQITDMVQLVVEVRRRQVRYFDQARRAWVQQVIEDGEVRLAQLDLVALLIEYIVVRDLRDAKRVDLPAFVEVIRHGGLLTIGCRRNKRCNDPQPLNREIRCLPVVPRGPQLSAASCASDSGADDMNELARLGANSSVDVPCSTKRPIAARVVKPLRVEDEFPVGEGYGDFVAVGAGLSRDVVASKTVAIRVAMGSLGCVDRNVLGQKSGRHCLRFCCSVEGVCTIVMFHGYEGWIERSLYRLVAVVLLLPQASHLARCSTAITLAGRSNSVVKKASRSPKDWIAV